MSEHTIRHLGEEGKFTIVEPVFIGGEWYAPTKYIKLIPDSVVFNKAIFIDRHNQNITTLERKEKGYWLIRSMNPATTGQHRPPYAQETPLGMFVLQEKKTKMIFLKDGSAATGGFAPYAVRVDTLLDGKRNRNRSKKAFCMRMEKLDNGCKVTHISIPKQI